MPESIVVVLNALAPLNGQMCRRRQYRRGCGPPRHTSTLLCAWIIVMLAIAGLSDGVLRAQSASRTSSLRGSWAAAAPPNRVFQGTWTADPVPNDPNSFQGTWTLLNGSRIAAEGTWSATKTARIWSGSWRARVNASGQLMSGIWRTQVSTSNLQTLGELLRQTLDDQVTGTWSSGRLTGSWSLRSF